jgi:hypothetical protein
MSKDVGAVLASGRTNDIRTFKHPDVLGTSPQKRVRAEEEHLCSSLDIGDQIYREEGERRLAAQLHVVHAMRRPLALQP